MLADQRLQHRSPLDQPVLAHILAVMVQQIEGIEDQALGVAGDRGSKRMIIEAASLVLDDDLAVDDGALAGQILRRGDDRRVSAIFAVMIMAVSKSPTM